MEIDLDALSLKELKALQGKVAKAVADYDQRMKREAAAELEARARELGYSLDELLNAKGKKKASAPPKFAHPEDPSQTWTGRGRQPQWFRDALASGKTEEDLAI
jgi:DNA-binding protein H-NS